MFKKIINILTILLFILFFITIVFNIDILKISINYSFNLFFKNLFPFLFISLIINNILININFPFFFNKLFHNIYIYVFFISLLGGSPLNAIIIKDYLDKKYIDIKNASLLLSVTCFCNPLFIINYSKILFNNYLKIILLYYFVNIIIFIIVFALLPKSAININYQNYNIKDIFLKSISNSILSLLNIFAIITFFILICNIFLYKTNNFSILLRGIIEISQGINLLYLISKIKIRELYFLIILLFSGFSIHIQISNYLSNYDINYLYFYIIRIILILLSFLILIIL